VKAGTQKYFASSVFPLPMKLGPYGQGRNGRADLRNLPALPFSIRSFDFFPAYRERALCLTDEQFDWGGFPGICRPKSQLCFHWPSLLMASLRLVYAEMSLGFPRTRVNAERSNPLFIAPIGIDKGNHASTPSTHSQGRNAGPSPDA
jgi:hypothetical protein